MVFSFLLLLLLLLGSPTTTTILFLHYQYDLWTHIRLCRPNSDAQCLENGNLVSSHTNKIRQTKAGHNTVVGVAPGFCISSPKLRASKIEGSRKQQGSKDTKSPESQAFLCSAYLMQTSHVNLQTFKCNFKTQCIWIWVLHGYTCPCKPTGFEWIPRHRFYRSRLGGGGSHQAGIPIQHRQCKIRLLSLCVLQIINERH